MRWSALAVEAWRNVRSGTALSAQLAAALAVLVGVLCAVALADTAALVARAAQYRAAGADVLIVRAEDGVDPVACDALAGTAGVESGAVRRADADLVAAVLPGSSVPTWQITGGVPALLGARAEGAGILESREVAETLGGATLATTGGPAPVAGVYDYPHDGRRTDLQFAVLSPTAATTPFDECWARTWPPTPDLESLLRTALLDAHADDIEVLQLNGSLGAGFAGQELFASRPTRWLPPLAGLAAAVVVLAAGRMRRLEFASARHSGVRLADLWLIVMLEGAAWTVPVVLAAAWGALVARAPDPATTAWTAASIAVPALLGGAAGATLAVLPSRESALFAHTRARR